MNKNHYILPVLTLIAIAILAIIFNQKGGGPAVEKEITSDSEPTAEVSPETFLEPLDSICNAEQCLFSLPSYSGTIVGLTNVSGFYKKSESLGFDDETYECDAIKVTDGDERILDSFKELIQDGNTINSYEEGRLVVLLDTSSLSSEEKERLRNSSAELKLVVVRKKPREGSTGVCAGFIDVVKIK